MNDFFNEIFTSVANYIKQAHGEEVIVRGEYITAPKDFPTVTIDETFNIPVSIDSGEQKLSAVTYRIQIFSNKEVGKRAEARSIFKTISNYMYGLNLIQKTYTAIPDVYNGSVYEIQATFEGTINGSGTIFRR